jgi:hypothetical protein
MTVFSVAKMLVARCNLDHALPCEDFRRLTVLMLLISTRLYSQRQLAFVRKVIFFEPNSGYFESHESDLPIVD